LYHTKKLVVPVEKAKLPYDDKPDELSSARSILGLEEGSILD